MEKGVIKQRQIYLRRSKKKKTNASKGKRAYVGSNSWLPIFHVVALSASPFHFEQYMRELLVEVKKGPTWSCQSTTQIQKMDLYLEAIASMPITFIWKHIDVDKILKKYAAQSFALRIEKKRRQLLRHLNMMVQHILLVLPKKIVSVGQIRQEGYES